MNRLDNVNIVATGTTAKRTLADWVEKEILSYSDISTAKADLKLEVGRRIKTYGYSTVGDGGGAEYVVVPSGTGADDGGSYHNMTNGNQLELITNGFSVCSAAFGVEHFPTVSTTKVSKFIEFCADNDLIAKFTGNMFKFTVASTKACNIECAKGFNVEPELSSDVAALRFDGVISSTKYQLSGTFNRNATTITTTSAVTDIAEGDLFILQDNTSRATDGGVEINVEVQRARSVSGSTIVLDSYVRAEKAPHADNIYKLTTLKDITIKGWKFNAVAGSVANSGLLFTACENVEVDGFVGRQSAGESLTFRKCYNVRVSNWDIREPQSTGSGQGYGISALRGTTLIHIGAGVGQGLRHSVDFDSCWDVTSDWFDCYDSPNQNDVMFAHNGWGGDFQDFKFRVRGGAGQAGYVSLPANTGATNYSKTVHNLNIKIDAKVALATGVAGFQSEQPLIDSNIDVKSVHGDGSKPTTFLSSATGVRLVSDKCSGTRVKVHTTGATMALFRRNSDAGFGDATFDITAVNCYQAALIQDSTEVNIANFDMDNIHERAFQYDGAATLRKVDVKTVSIKNLNADLTSIPASRVHPQGAIGNFGPCYTDQASVPTAVLDGFNITVDQLLRGVDGQTVFLTAATPVTAAATAFEQGFYSGQKITLVNDQTTNTITIPHSTQVQNSGAVSVTLGEVRRSATWVYNSVVGRWYESA